MALWQVISNESSRAIRTMVAAYRTISRRRSQIVTDYRTMVVQWSCSNRRLPCDLDSKILRSLTTYRKAIVVWCVIASTIVVKSLRLPTTTAGSRRSWVVVASRLTGALRGEVSSLPGGGGGSPCIFPHTRFFSGWPPTKLPFTLNMPYKSSL